ncbi:beta-agarase [Namhaeicola litoreus]|uniref:Beta-agarase n=1 Tax=Namhaeicola litoreus TaxID=1052145 RepID=A0ABW3Y014_9FLAO
MCWIKIQKWNKTLRYVIATLFFLSVLMSCKKNESQLQTDPFWNDFNKIELLNFEEDLTSTSITSINAKVEAINDIGVTHGESALKIVFKSDEKQTGIKIEPKTPIDASKLKDFCLVFDATNPGDFSTHLYVEITNHEGKTRTRSVSVPVNTTKTYFFELEGKYLRTDTNLRDNPKPWNIPSVQMKMRGRIEPIDFSKITSITFYTKNTLHNKEVVLDNVLLVETPEISNNYLVGIIDKYGQNAKFNFEGKITSDNQLKAMAQAELKQLEEEGPMGGRSTFGGWLNGPKLNATGYFRTEKVDNKWALIDPKGYLFFSIGIANVRMANTTTFTGVDFKNEKIRSLDPEEVTPEDSKGMVKLGKEITNTSYIAYPERNKMFLELPTYDDPLANHYSYRRKQHFGPFAHGETFSFYQANLERRYGETKEGEHLKKWVDVTLKRFLNWGFTSFGNWAGYEFYHENRMPYFADGWIIGDYKTVRSGYDFWGEMPDVFDPEFTERTKLTINKIAEEVKNNPYCIGVFVDNEKSWGVPGTVKGQYGIVLDALSMPAIESPLKKEFTRLLKAKYQDIKVLNEVWETNIINWSSLESGLNLKEQEAYTDSMVTDFSMLLEVYATKYFEVVHDVLEEIMPNHMYMGCRFAPWGMGKEVLRAAKKYVDVMSYNYYEEGIGKKYWSFLEEIDKPSIIGEFHIGTAVSGLFHPGVIHAADHNDRARMYKEYLNSVIDNPYFVGAHWFQYIDSPVSGRAHDGENYNVGFVTNTDVPYPSMVKAAKEINSELYARRFNSPISNNK